MDYREENVYISTHIAYTFTYILIHPKHDVPPHQLNYIYIVHFSGGGGGLIQSVNPQHVQIPGFINLIRVFVTDTFRFESFSDSPGQQHTLGL